MGVPQHRDCSGLDAVTFIVQTLAGFQLLELFLYLKSSDSGFVIAINVTQTEVGRSSSEHAS